MNDAGGISPAPDRQAAANLVIRILHPEDHAGLPAFWTIVWTATYRPSLGPTILGAMLAGLWDGHRALLPGTGEHCVIATLAGQTAGTVIWRENGPTAYVWGMYVHPDRQRSGIGSRLLRAAARSLTVATRLEVRVLSTSPHAIAFYRKPGFWGTGTERTPLMGGSDTKTLVMAAEAVSLFTSPRFPPPALLV